MIPKSYVYDLEYGTYTCSVLKRIKALNFYFITTCVRKYVFFFKHFSLKSDFYFKSRFVILSSSSTVLDDGVHTEFFAALVLKINLIVVKTCVRKYVLLNPT